MITVREPEEMHMAGLLLSRVLERAARACPEARLPGNVAVLAGGMATTIVPGEGGHELRRGVVDPVASLRAPLPTLLALAGGGSILRALVGGLRVSGSLRALWALRALLARKS